MEVVTVRMMRFLALILMLSSVQLLAQDSIKVGLPAPTFFLTALDGSKFFLSEYIAPQGRKTVVLDFFATWCGPCKKELPVLDALVKKYPRDSVLLVLVDVGEKRETVVANFNAAAYSWPVLLDQFSAVSDKYNAKILPSLFIIDSGGIVRYMGSGYDEKKGLSKAAKILDQVVYKKGLKGKRIKS